MTKILLGIVDLIGRLPLSVLYLLSDLSYWIVYRIFGYRTKVVKENLRLSFPEKSDKERLKIERDFYRNFFDVLIETLYSTGMTKEEIKKRVELETPEIFQEIEDKNQSAIFVTGHYNNWEWLGRRFIIDSGDKAIIAYKKITNKAMDEYIFNSRSKFGGHIVHIESFLRFVIKHRKEVKYTYLIADQTPHVDQIEFVTPFLNQDTAVYLGAENLSKTLKQPIYFLKMTRKKRGYYSYSIELVSTDHQADLHTNTKKHLVKLERDIKENPACWLWTHRRWKYTRK
jgi:KDO2-lipid IV(A) lauroyltransferase